MEVAPIKLLFRFDGHNDGSRPEHSSLDGQAEDLYKMKTLQF